jgi:hypothetical protein
VRTTFLIGRLTPGGREMVVLDEAHPSPLPGPWVLRAVVGPAGAAGSFLATGPGRADSRFEIPRDMGYRFCGPDSEGGPGVH